jgi:hypothetical protein
VNCPKSGIVGVVVVFCRCCIEADRLGDVSLLSGIECTPADFNLVGDGWACVRLVLDGSKNEVCSMLHALSPSS